MLLAIDAGNTHIMLGVYEKEKLKAHWRISTDKNKTEDEYVVIIKNLLALDRLELRSIEAVVISTVVPPLVFPFKKMVQKYFKLTPLFIGSGVKTGLNILMDNPREVGADRVVNAVGAYHLYGGPLIIVDFGTATTFCAISAKGEYRGGAIAPGIGISVEALFRYAAKLPRVEMVKPDRVIGKDTVPSMQSGIIYGFAGQVDGIVRRMSREFESQPMVIATGGHASLIAAEAETVDRIDPFLTLEGLRIIYNKNRL